MAENLGTDETPTLKERVINIVKPVSDKLDLLADKLEDFFIKDYRKGSKIREIPLLYRKLGKYLSSNQPNNYTLDKLPKFIYSVMYRTNKFATDNNLVTIVTYCWSMLRAGRTEFDAFDALAGNMALPPYIRLVCRDIANKMKNGSSLTTVLEEHYPKVFSEDFIFRIKAAQSVGTQQQVYKDLQEYYTQRIKYKKMIHRTLAYPIMLISIMLGMVVGFKYYFLPIYLTSTGMKEDQLLGSFKTMLMLANMLTSVKGLIQIAMFCFLVKQAFTKVSLGRKLYSMALLTMPRLNKLFILINTNAWFRELDVMLSHRLPEIEAVDRAVKSVSNELIRNTLIKTYEPMKSKSGSFYECSSDIPFYNQEVKSLIKMGEESANVAVMIHNIHIRSEEELEDLFAQFNTMITPILIVILGIFIVAVIMPVFNDITGGGGVI